MAKTNYTPTNNVTTAQIEPELQANDNIILQMVALNNAGGAITLGALTDDSLPSIDLSNGGLISGGIIQDTGDGLTADGGTLNEVTYEGTLNVGNGLIHLVNNLTAAGLNGTGAGSITVDDGFLLFEDLFSFDNATITLTNGAHVEQYNAFDGSHTQSLSFGSKIVIDQASGTGTVDSSGASPPTGDGSTITNSGEIETQGSGSQLQIYPLSFTNYGTLNVAGTNTSIWIYADEFTNSGTIDVASGDTLELGRGNGTYTTGSALGGTINAGSGTIELDDEILSNGGTLSIGSGSGIGTFLLHGADATVVGGVIQDGGSGLQSDGGTLYSLTYEGALNLEGGSLYVDDGTVFTGAGGAGLGSITVASANLYFDNSQTIDNATIALTGDSDLEQYTTYTAYKESGGIEPTKTLILGSKLVVDATSGVSYISTDDSYSNTSSVVNDGKIDAQGSELDILPSAFTNNSIVEAEQGGQVDLNADSVTNLSADPNHVFGSVLTGGTYEVFDGAANAGSYIAFTGRETSITTLAAAVDITGANSQVSGVGGGSLDDTLDDIAAAGTLNLYYSAASNTQALFDDKATTLFVDGTANLYGAVLEAKALTIDSAGVVTGVGQSNGSTPEAAEIEGPVTNNGVIVAGVSGAGNPAGDPECRLDILGAVTGAGKLEIQGNTIAELSGVSHGQEILFENTETTEPATLQIDTNSVGSGASPQFASTIYGLKAGDVIDLAQFNYANLTGHSFNGTTLSLTFSGAVTSASLTFFGLNAGETFNFGGDGGSGMDVSLACFCRGTRIATREGEIAVEDLRPGDRVETASGAYRPVRWLGHRRLDARRLPTPEPLWPVRVAAHAFGQNRPHRDLWLSPGHNIAWEGVLIPIVVLINGQSVAQIETADVEYWHVELDTHDILLSENLPSESYLDCGNRCAFANGGAFLEAHPDFRPKHYMQTCLPIALEGSEVVSAKQHLIDVLGARGVEPSEAADVHIVADGRRFEAIALGPDCLAFVLPADRKDIELRSNTFIPAWTRAESGDRRTLGLCVARLQIDGEDVALDGAALEGEGWSFPENNRDGRVWRWTKSAVRLKPHVRLVAVKIAGRGLYWPTPNRAAMTKCA